MIRSACLVGVLTFASLALAQEPAPVSPSPPPPPPAESMAPAAPAPTLAQPSPEEKIRLRGGLGVGLGLFFPGPSVSFTVEGRIGAQLNKYFGAYLQVSQLGGFGLGVSASATGASASISLVGYNQFSLLGDVLIADRFFIALGPTVINGGWLGFAASANQGGGTVSAYGAGPGFIPGVAAKVGYVGGGDRKDPVTGRRSGFTVSLDFGAIFGKQSSGAVEANAKGGSVGLQLDQPVTGIPVLLMFGYEWR